MKLIDRYIFKELLFPFFSGVLAFSIILSSSTILFQMIGNAVKYHIPITDVIVLIILKLPYIISLSIPMATLFATISAFGRLGNDLEILAFRAHGISMLRLFIPVIVFGCCMSLLTILFNETIVPKASTTSHYLFNTYRYTDVPDIQTNISLTEYKNNKPARIINVLEKEKDLLKNITIAEYDDGVLARLIRAKTGYWLKGKGWEFHNGLMHLFQQQDPRRVTVIEFEKEFINSELEPIDFSTREAKAEEMTQQELSQHIEKTRRIGKDPIKLIMDYHMKISVAFSSLIYTLLGACMGLRPHRTSSYLGIGLSLIVIFIYIILLSIGMGLGLSKTIPPLMAAWFPNVIIGLVGIGMVRRLVRQ